MDLNEIKKSLPTEEEKNSVKDEICFYSYNMKKRLSKRQLMEIGFELGYNYLRRIIEELILDEQIKEI